MSESAAHIATRNAAIRGLYAVTPDESDTSVLALLREARAALTVPVVAIGGITAANTAMLITAGADSVAVISAFFAASDV